MCNPFFWTLLEMCQRASEVFGSLDPPLQSMPPSQPHPCACTVLCCAYLSPKTDQGHLSQEKCCPTSVWPPSPASPCSFSQCYYQQSLVVITTNPWLAPQLSGFETYNTHQPLVFYRNMWANYSGLRSYFMLRKECWVNLSYFLCAMSLEYLHKHTSLFLQVVSYRTSLTKP